MLTTSLGIAGLGGLQVLPQALGAAFYFARPENGWSESHPAGSALAHAYLAMTWVWFPMLMGWAAKAAILRSGGMKLYRAWIPLFLGLILGDIVIGVLWSLVGAALGIDIYMFFPG